VWNGLTTWLFNDARRGKRLTADSVAVVVRGYARLLRPANALIAAAAVCVGAVVAVGTSEAALQWQAVAFGAVVAFLFTGAGNALNDVYDRETDRVNHPDRPIPSGQVSPRAASVLAGSLFAAAILAGMSINIPASGLVLASLALMVAYEERFKASGWSGNLLIAWLVGSLFVFAGLCVYGGRVEPLAIAASLAVLAGLSTVAREVVKDIEDLAGDVDRATLPRRRGIPFAGRVAQAFLAAAVVLSVLPAILGILGPWYPPLVAAADAIFIYAAWHATRSPGRSERAMKGAMVVALAAFLAGGLA